MDASAYIKELKQKVVRLNQEIACAQDALRHKSSYPTVYFNHIAYIYLLFIMQRYGIDIHGKKSSCTYKRYTIDIW
jgi:hypothetical protein